MICRSIEKITNAQLADLRRLVRAERRKREQQLSHTTALELLELDLSVLFVQAEARSRSPAETIPIEDVPEIQAEEMLCRFRASDVGEYENENDVALLMLAREAGSPLLVKFKYAPSQRFETDCAKPLKRAIANCTSFD